MSDISDSENEVDVVEETLNVGCVTNKEFFSLLVSEGVIIDSRTDPRSRISLPRLIIIFIINQGQ
jgi:hypothetical protein